MTLKGVSKIIYDEVNNLVVIRASRNKGVRTVDSGYIEIVEDADGKPVRIIIHKADEVFADIAGLFVDFEQSDYVTIQELAKMKGVAQQTIRNHITLGKLPALKIGEGSRAIVLIKREDAENFRLDQAGRPKKVIE